MMKRRQEGKSDDMEIAMKDGELLMRNLDNVQYQLIRNTGKCKWDKKRQLLIGPADIELLEQLNRIIRLPESIAKEYKRLKAVQDAIDKERMNEDPKPLIDLPVKIPLFKHQVRGVNMALLTFGVVEGKNTKDKDKKI